MAAARVLLRLVRDPSSAGRVGANQGAVRQATAVFQVLTRKLESERKYLARLEGPASTFSSSVQPFNVAYSDGEPFWLQFTLPGIVWQFT